MRADAVELARIETHRGAFRTHLGAYQLIQFIETRLAERMRADPGGFARIYKFSQINNAVGCGQICQDAGGNIL